jgi:cysteine-rich repeat protein
MRFKLGISVVAVALVSLGASRAADAQVYGPYTFDANSWVTSATLTGYCYPFPSGACDANVIGHSPTVCGANLQCAPGNYLELFFGNTTIKNNPGVDLVVFDTRFSTDAASIAVETSPGVFTAFETWAVDEQFPFGAGTGCDGNTLVAVPVDLSRFGLPLGFTTQRIRVGGNSATGSCQFDLTMAGVPTGAPVCSMDSECNDGNPCTTDVCSGAACAYSPSGALGCVPVCGDGLVGAVEGCDDGNSMAGDGCSGMCQVEAGYECMTPAAPCTDIDECVAGTDECDVNATCLNAPGTFTCTCNAGFMGDGVTCTDIDECATGADDCDVNAVCANTSGTFTCTCNAGFTGDGVTCADIDECAAGTGNCDPNAACANTPGTFTCTCNAGFTGDGVTCADIDECALGTDECDANAACANLPGSFSCVCNEGYTGNGMICATVCGDGVVAGAEACDDANAVNGDGCSNTCGVEPGWTCGGMPSICETGACGDGIVAGVEGCDDGNTASGDGCSSTCSVQDGWICDGAPSVCGAAACGDGIIAGVEGCDDANTASGDGCAVDCNVEEGWTCKGAPSVCSNECEVPGSCSDDPTDEGSCACNAPGSGSSGGGIGLAAGLLALFLGRQRRAAARSR